MPEAKQTETAADPSTQSVARLILYSFLLTFLIARVMVLLIMLRAVPSLYLHVGATHVHHLNYGIFLLSGVGGFLLLARPGGAALGWAAAIYGIALALTFDEFGMWVHLGGPYWQRASFDAVVVIGSVLTLVVIAPRWTRLKQRHFVAAILVGILGLAFGWELYITVQRYADRHDLLPALEQIEARGPR